MRRLMRSVEWRIYAGCFSELRDTHAGISAGHCNLSETAMLLARLIWLLVMLAAALSPFFGEPDE